ncbi:heparinase II/III domain-containing protein [Hymenobacter volaticus]|uniref:Heparinase II/III family protein n=1 Tax=Hymenobacter volaticus TaxID=2932254 RepID=A0ABY4GCE3_9BACT|nr:heparinase II/III family protein [Hymenobacter volaticus]UOQ68608.1 heparinase II/III family protein [Hymenobacter volaticus]
MAFIFLLDRAPNAGAIQALPLTEQDTLRTRVIRLLAQCNTVVDSPTAYTEWQWRSKELIDYLIAYDLLRGAGVPASTLASGRARLQEFASNLQRQSTTAAFGLFYSQVKNNHALMTAAALGMAGVVLNEATGTATHQQPLTWINTGLYTIDNVLWRDTQRQSDSTTIAGYAEGPYYFKYAFLNCLPFFRAMGNFLPDQRGHYSFGASTRSIRNPYYDPKYNLLYEWITRIQMPDGRFPALEDSYVDMGMPELALTGQSRYLNSLHVSQLSGSSLTSLTAQLRDITVDMRAAYLAANLTPTNPSNTSLTILPESGNLVFRSGNDTLSSYLHLYGQHGLAQTNGGGHSQGDASSFILHAHGELLALDAGYLSYARRGEVSQALNHNLILVDDAGPAPGTPGEANDAEATIQNGFDLPQLAYAEVQTTYPKQKTSITRKTLFVRNSYYLLADFVEAAVPHTYTWQLHGHGLQNSPTPSVTGTFTDHLATHEGIWQKNQARLRAHVTATNGASGYSTATRQHETTYNTAENHTTLLVRKSGQAQTQFLAALVPSTTTSPGPAVHTVTTSGSAALVAATSDFQDLAFAQADTVSTSITGGALPQPLQADGLLNFYSLTPTYTFAQAFFEEGTSLSYGGTPYVSSSKRATISWQQDATSFEGYVSRGTVLTLRVTETPTAITGEALTSYVYDAATQQLQLTFAQASHFRGQLAARPLPVELLDFTAERQAATVKVTWQTASEHNNLGFAIERKSSAAADFQQIGFQSGTGATKSSTYSFQDTAPPTSLTYYRLKQLDQQGSVQYSPVVAVGVAAVHASLTAFPIPAQQTLTVSYSEVNETVEVLLRNQQGQVVLRRFLHQQVVLPVHSLPPGLYYLQAVNASGVMVAKPVKVAINR